MWLVLAIIGCTFEVAPLPGPPPLPPRCHPTFTMTSAAPVVEGDTVTGGLGCGSGATAELRWVEFPSGAVVDEATASLTWDTTLSDAGRHRLVFDAQVEGRELESVVAWIDVDDAWGVEDNVPVDPARYVVEQGLPVLHIDVPPDTLTEDWAPTVATFDGVPYGQTEMKKRGASSLAYPKNSYTLAFRGQPLDLSAEDLGTRRHLVLVTTFDDNSYVRQKLIYDTWADMAEFWGATHRPTPRPFYVVVYMGGEYHGLYVAIDRIDDNFFGDHGFNEHGNLYKSVNHDANFKFVRSDGSPKTTLHDGWEKKEGLPEDDFSDLDALTDFVASSDAPTFMADADTWIDTEAFMDWFHLVYWTVAQDSAGKNAYLYSDPSAEGFQFVPWDFNHAFGQDWRTVRVPAETDPLYRSNNRIFSHFQDDPDTAPMFWDRLRAVRAPGAPLHADALQSRIDAYYAEMEPAADKDWAKWGGAHRGYGGWQSVRSDWTEWPEERLYLEQWIAERGVLVEQLHP